MAISGPGFLGAGLAQGLSQGVLQGEQLKRQQALTDAYMKHQASQDEMMKQFRASQEEHARFAEATSPFSKIETPITAQALAPGFAEAAKYAKDPSGYTRTEAGVPAAPNYVMSMPGAEGQQLAPGAFGGPSTFGTPAEPPPSPAGAPQTYTGAEAFGRAIQGPMAAATQAQQDYVDKLFGQKKALVDAGLAKQMFMADYRTALSAKKDVNQALMHAKISMMSKLLGGQVQLPDGMDAMMFVNQLAEGIGGGGAVPQSPELTPPGRKPQAITPGVKPMPSAEAKTINAAQEGISYLQGLKQSLSSGQVDTGLGMAIRTSPTANKIASALGVNLATEDEQKVATALGEHLMVVARSMFPGRVSNFDLQYLDKVVGRPAYSTRDNLAKIDALLQWAQEKSRIEGQSLGERGFGVPGGGPSQFNPLGGGGQAAPAAGGWKKVGTLAPSGQ